jgi:hypothetical protein
MDADLSAGIVGAVVRRMSEDETAALFQKGARCGCQDRADARFRISGLPPGRLELDCTSCGRRPDVDAETVNMVKLAPENLDGIRSVLGRARLGCKCEHGPEQLVVRIFQNASASVRCSVCLGEPRVFAA